MAYSVANLDDRSWGTREEKKTKKKTPVISMNSFHDVVSCFKKFFVYDWRSIVRLNDMSSLLHIRVTSALALQDISSFFLTLMNMMINNPMISAASRIISDDSNDYIF